VKLQIGEGNKKRKKKKEKTIFLESYKCPKEYVN